MRRSPVRLALVLLGGATLEAAPAAAQQPAGAAAPADTAPAPGRARARRWRAVHANEYETPFMTIRVGAGFLIDFASYAQDDDAGDQVDVVDMGKIRDSRFLLGGRLMTKRKINWSTGLFYDFYTSKWRVRQTGFVVDVPEISSNFWIGRTKEGPSLNRVMVGYDGWTNERFTFSDAAIPLLADGVRWQGYLERANFFWNLGAYTDYLSDAETWSYFENQVAGRFGYVAMDADTAGRLVHLGLGFHAGIPNDGFLQLKSKPESFSAPNYIDTGKLPSTSAALGGLEAYYRAGSWLFGAEYYGERVRLAAVADTGGGSDDDPGGADRRLPRLPAHLNARVAARADDDGGNPLFHGGDVAVSWLITGETRRYVPLGSYFDAVTPRRSVFDGGPGAWEGVLRFSYADLNDKGITGGTFWRITPMVNWHLSDEVRLEFAYGYGVLDRFGMRGGTHFYQARLQTQY